PTAWYRWSTYEGRAARTSHASRTLVLQDIEPGIGVGHIHDAVVIDEHVAGLNDLGRVRPLVDDRFRRRRHEVADLLWLIGVAHIVNAQAGIVVSGKHGVLGLRRARAVLVQVMRAEFRALLAEIV